MVPRDVLVEYIKGFLKIFLWPLYWLSGFFPRNPRVWVFGSWDGKRFADNARWFFLYCLKEHKEEIELIWVTRDRKLARNLQEEQIPACCSFSLKGLWYTLRAGIYVFDAYVSAINFWTSRKSVKVNLWHGIPLKKIERDISNEYHILYKQFHGSFVQRAILAVSRPAYNVKYDLFISTSSQVREVFSKAFNVSRERVPIVGYPRNDLLHSNECSLQSWEESIVRKIETLKNAGKKIVFYLPTFRDTNLVKELPLDWERVDKFLEGRNAALLVKLHSSDKSRIPPLKDFGCLYEFPHGVDPYPALKLTDVLITDYSSIYFDFLLLDRPILFYPYDLEVFLKRERPFYLSYDHVTPGMKAYTFDELLAGLEIVLGDDLSGEVTWAEERKRISEMCHAYRDGKSSARVYGEIFGRFCLSEKGKRGAERT